MITLSRRTGPFRQLDVYYPRPDELAAMIASLAPTDVIIARQAPERLQPGPSVLSERPFDTSLLNLNYTLGQLELQMDKKSCRYEIRKAQKMGDRVQVLRNDDAGRERFLEIYNRFVERKGYAGPLRLSKLDHYAPVSDIWLAYADGRPVCGHLLVRDAQIGRVGLVLSASVELQDPALAPLNRFLHWYEICQYKAEGFRLYDFGGVNPGKVPGIARFKLSFGGNLVTEYHYTAAGSLARCAIRLRELSRKFLRATGLQSDRGSQI